MAIDYRGADTLDAYTPLDGVAEIDERQLETAGWSDARNAPVGYWRLKDDRMERGRISLLPYGFNATERDEQRHEQKLSRYDTYKGGASQRAWQLIDPFLAIVQRGGLHEFDAQQILDLGWHRRPTRQSRGSHHLIWRQVERQMAMGMDERSAVLTVMPQLAGRDLNDYRCEFCPGRVFSARDSLRAHESVVHKEDVRSREIRDSVSGALATSGDKSAEAMAMIAQALQMLTQAGVPVELPAKRGPGRPRKEDDAAE